VPDDELDPTLDPTLDPADEARVRRLLAEARHVGPVPDDVARRLDAALVRLVEERTARAVNADKAAVVVDLAARRRRRRIGAALVAAAATVVLGVSLPSLTGNLTVSGGDSPEAVTAEDSAGQAREFQEGEGGAADSTAPSTKAEAEPDAPLMTPIEISADQFKQDAVAARDQAPAYGLSARSIDCVQLPATSAQVVPVTYGGRDGLLVFGEPTGDRQRVSLYLCPEAEPVRSATVPAP
jgi:hypothetical protein